MGGGKKKKRKMLPCVVFTKDDLDCIFKNSLFYSNNLVGTIFNSYLLEHENYKHYIPIVKILLCFEYFISNTDLLLTLNHLLQFLKRTWWMHGLKHSVFYDLNHRYSYVSGKKKQHPKSLSVRWCVSVTASHLI